jgi:murein DD-endopeptidase MepM/ murein hydrolase activator NlpD
MPTERDRHLKKTGQYEIVVIPVGQGGRSRNYRVSRRRLWLWGAISLFVLASGVLAALLYTPLVRFVPIPSTVLEEKYGRQLLETQSELRTLAQEMIVLKEYNSQLKRVLGGEGGETSRPASESSEVPVSQPEIQHRESLNESTLVAEYGHYEADISAYNSSVADEPLFRAQLPMTAPVTGILSQHFNPERLHFGVDYATATGSPVFAAAEGYIVFSGWTYEDGNMVMISHGGGYLSVYKHNEGLLKTARTHVKRGEVIALTGSTAGRAGDRTCISKCGKMESRES